MELLTLGLDFGQFFKFQGFNANAEFVIVWTDLIGQIPPNHAKNYPKVGLF